MMNCVCSFKLSSEHEFCLNQIRFLYKSILYASNISFYSYRVTDTVVKPRICIDIFFICK